MKTSFTVLATVLSLAFSASALAAAPTEADKERCFKNHKQLMHKPALQNQRDCWNAHKHLHTSQ